ncbi:MAG TPA: DUF481 domain-containing protein [Planctomycetota bacterium]|nr:DUF481 domain-containing protein [Planctomycetota bacterium]
MSPSLRAPSLLSRVAALNLIASLSVSIFVVGAILVRSPRISAQDDAQDTSSALEAAIEGEAESPVEPGASTIYDEIRLKDGSLVIGEIVSMAGGNLEVKTAFAVNETVTIQWSAIDSIRTARAHAFRLADGSSLRGRVLRTENGSLVIAGESVEGTMAVPLAAVQDVNPPETKDVTLTGNLSLGVQIADGNTQTKGASFVGEIVARSERQRLTLRGAWNYAEDSVSGVTARNTLGTIKYDFFLTERVFLFASALFEEDRFQDLNLRTALAAGPGYQFVKRGDFEDRWLSGLEIYGEVGIAYFNEDFRMGADNRYVSARWSLKADLPLNDRLSLFHFHEGYPGLEDLEDLYILTQQGIRLTIWEGFLATLQVNWRWDNTPSPGFERSDTLYLVTLGYQFEI